MSRRAYLALSALALAACGYGTVDVQQFDPEPGTSDGCQALFRDLPKALGDAVRRDVSVDEPLAMAWGQPAIVLRCGVPMPAAYRPDGQLFKVDGVGWLVEEGKGGTFFTSADREVLVEVSVPDDYAPEAQILTDLAPALTDHLPPRELR